MTRPFLLAFCLIALVALCVPIGLAATWHFAADALTRLRYGRS